MDWLTHATGFSPALVVATGLLAAAGCAAAGWFARGVTVGPALREGDSETNAPAPPAVEAPPGAIEAAGPETAAGPDASSIHELMVAAIDQADELITIVTTEGAMVYANAAFCRELGYALADVRQLRAAYFLGEQSRSPLEEIEAAVKADGVWRGTLVRRRRDDTTFHSSCSVMALAGDPSHLPYFVVIERDITREAQLREQLIHSERLAAVGQLVSGVAHELNNPLQAIIGFTELLMEGERRTESRSDLDQVRSEAHRAAKIVRNLLAFVRRAGVERGPTSLNEVVEATVALRKHELTQSGVTIEEVYAPDLPMVLMNREEIQQVLLNLLLNAEHAVRGSDTEGRLWLRTSSTADGVALELRDNGPGVPATLARRIFEPFYSTKGVGEGTGLGLSIALGIAEAHGGTLTLIPCDTGASFLLTLPAGLATPAPAVEREPGASWSAVPGRRALVAEDDQPLRHLLQRLLTRRGFAVDTAEDGLQAAGMIERHRYDVILCDLQMPRMTGTQLYASVRRRQPHLGSAFVMISGEVLSGPLQSFVESAKIPLLSKPFGARTLDIALEQVLTHRMQSSDVPGARSG